MKKKSNLCVACGCKKEREYKAQTLWGKDQTYQIGFCKDHAPDWLRNISPGEFSPETPMFGINKSWYKRVS